MAKKKCTQKGNARIEAIRELLQMGDSASMEDIPALPDNAALPQPEPDCQVRGSDSCQIEFDSNAWSSEAESAHRQWRSVSLGIGGKTQG